MNITWNIEQHDMFKENMLNNMKVLLNNMKLLLNNMKLMLNNI